MRSSHSSTVASINATRFDEPNLLSHAGVVPVMDLAQRAGLVEVLER